MKDGGGDFGGDSAASRKELFGGIILGVAVVESR